MKWFHPLTAVIGLFAAGEVTAAAVDYVREIKPILTEACYKCHGASQQKGGLRMDTAVFAVAGGDTGPAYVAGKSKESLMIQAMRDEHDTISRMPYKRPALSEEQIALIAKWVDEGAVAPADEEPEKDIHWSFVPPERPKLPAIKNEKWVKNPIDHFILARLEQEKLQPAPEADRVTLIRRVSLDLLGLPPTIEEVDAFLKDTSPDAYEKLVDRLLTSPHFGERWGRHWLDGARYADSHGYSIDAPRSIWKYRDWVINALNSDMPFDQFTIEQLAGDLLPDPTLEQRIATGFHRNTQINEEGGIDKEQFRIESILDRVNTTSTVFLGLTVACAQCHDHKFDPIAQKEYFQLYAFLNNADEPTLEVAPPEAIKARDLLRAQIKAETQKFNEAVASAKDVWEKSLDETKFNALRPEVRKALEKLANERNDKEKKILTDTVIAQDESLQKAKTALDELRKSEPKFPTTLVLTELDKPRDSYVFIKGDFTRQGEPVKPGVPAIMHPLKEVPQPNRLDLARWIVDPANPLTSRVTVNRFWQQYFGRGIVETDNDFGTQGIRPTHPELLDWLATEFIRQMWSMKAMHRLIVTSATYRQSSRARSDLDLIDATNKLLARQSRLRLDAEIVRDVALASSGLLSDEIGGPGVFPPQPEGVMNLGQSRREWKASTGEDRYRRGLYTYFWRATPHPSLTVFDAPDSFSACTRRLRSNTPLQALTLLNDQGFYEFAQGMAERILQQNLASDADRLRYAFQLCTARSPSAKEQQRLVELLELQRGEARPTDDEMKAMLPGGSKLSVDNVERAAWTTVARVLLNLDETITRE